MNNNFNLIRLLAALQVATTHIALYFQIDYGVLQLLHPFPGVPIFFFISGYLIYGSLGRSLKGSDPWLDFFYKRFLRIYPALWLCFIVSIILAWGSGYFTSVSVSSFDFFVWALAQNTFFQFFNSEFMRGYGVGVLNGSLWTISVELQFYVLVPFVFLFSIRSGLRSTVALMVFLVGANLFHTALNGSANVVAKLFSVSFFPWLYMFLMGFLAAKYNIVVQFVQRVNFALVLSLFLVSYFLFRGFSWGNTIDPISFVLLAALVLKAAYSVPWFSRQVLRGADISYGVYIYHMPIVNFLLHVGYSGGVGFVYAFLLTLALACFSWFFFERWVLSFK